MSSNTTLDFLEKVFHTPLRGEGFTSGKFIAVWPRGHSSGLFADHWAAATWALDKSEKADVYLQVAVIGDITGCGRACARDAVEVTALWADIDGEHITKAGVKKGGPTSLEAATEALDRLPIVPSVLVASGTPGSIHAYWVLEAPVTDMTAAAALVQGWQRVIRAEWRRRGWVLDFKHDLAAVLRLPGTLNHKFRPAREVRLLRLRSDRHETRAFELAVSRLPDEPHPAAKPSTLVTPTPPTLGDRELVDRIRRSRQGARFDRFWRGDLAGYDSPSNADYGLACMLSFWTRDTAQVERIVRSTLLAREKWNEPRPGGSYLSTTINRAAASITEHYEPKPQLRRARP